MTAVTSSVNNAERQDARVGGALNRAARIGRTLRRAARGAAAPLAVAVAVQSAGNLGFHAMVGRLLPADGYGALGAVLAAMVMLGVPLSTLQAAAATLVAEHGPVRATTVRVLRSVAVWSAPPAAVVLAAAPLLRDYFHLGSLFDAVQLAPYLVVAALLAAARGLLLGEGRVDVVARTYLMGTLVRFELGLVLVGPFGVSGALAGTLAGEAASLAVAVAALARGADRSSPGRRLRLATVARVAAAVTGLFLFSTVDLLLARHHLRGPESGAYVAAATVAKTTLALPAVMITAIYPRLIVAWPEPGRLRQLVAGGAIVVGPAVLGAAVVVVAAPELLQVLYGGGFPDAAGLVRTLTVVAALTSVVSLMTYAALARRAATIAVPWVGAAAEVVVIELWHGSATQIAVGSVAALVPTLLLIVALEVRAWRRRPAGRAPTEPVPTEPAPTEPAPAQAAAPVETAQAEPEPVDKGARRGARLVRHGRSEKG